MAVRLAGQGPSTGLGPKPLSTASSGGPGAVTGSGGINDAASSFSSGAASLPDVTAFSALARSSLTDALDRIAGAKTLVLDANLAGPLGLVAEMSLLRDHGVDRLFWLEPGALTQAQKNIVYVCRAEIGCMRIIADQIKAAPAALNHTYTILMCPRVTSVCASTLEDLGVLGSVDIHEFPMVLIPLERDVLSMELGSQAYRDIFLDSNYDSIYEMARALITLQRAYGHIPRLIGKGDAARRLVDIMSRLRKETAAASNSTSSSSPSFSGNYGQIDSMIILDRQVDMVTPLCTQLTYEGLIDEIIGIKNSFVEVDPALTNPAPPTPSSSSAPQFGGLAGPPKKKKHLLSTLGSASTGSTLSIPPPGQSGNTSSSREAQSNNGGDPLFGELRDKNFTVIGNILNRVAKKINQEYEARHAAQTVSQMRDFVGRLSGLQAEHQALRLHTGLTEQIMATTSSDEFNRTLEIQQNLIAGIDLSAQENVIRDLINQEANPTSILRLLCVYSLVAGGIKAKPLEDFKREFLQTYGFEYLPAFIHLEELNLLSRNSGVKAPFSMCRRPLRLVVDDVDESAPEDISYVYSGYAPVSVRLVQHAIGLGATSGGLVGGIAGAGQRDRNGSVLNGWKGLDDVLQALPGRVFEELQKPDDSSRRRQPFAQEQVPVSVVCFIGGCTSTEIAALRFTSQRMTGRKLLVVTTGIINGSSVIDCIGPPKSTKHR